MIKEPSDPSIISGVLGNKSYKLMIACYQVYCPIIIAIRKTLFKTKITATLKITHNDTLGDTMMDIVSKTTLYKAHTTSKEFCLSEDEKGKDFDMISE